MSSWGMFRVVGYGVSLVDFGSIDRRELLAPGSTGGLVIFDDRPNYWDAWGMSLFLLFLSVVWWLNRCSLDVEIHHLETAKRLEFTSVSVVAQGPLRGSVKAEVKYGKSLITVTVSCHASVFQDSSLSDVFFFFGGRYRLKL